MGGHHVQYDSYHELMCIGQLSCPVSMRVRYVGRLCCYGNMEYGIGMNTKS